MDDHDVKEPKLCLYCGGSGYAEGGEVDEEEEEAAEGEPESDVKHVAFVSALRGKGF